MNPKIWTGILAALLSVICFTASGQSVKEIINDGSGKYLYAQARDGDAQSAMALASDELKSRVEAHLSANRMQKYNQNWQECVKQIITEKYGRIRAFLYISVADLNPQVESQGSVSRDYTGEKSVSTSTPDGRVSTSVPSTPEKPVNLNSEKKEKSSMPEPPVMPHVPMNYGNAEDNTSISPADKNPVREYSPEEGPFPQGMLGDILHRVIEGGISGDISGQLSKGKNLRVISMFGNTDSKYIDHAYLITNDSGKLRIYTPRDKHGVRIDLITGSSTGSVAGKLLYWFLKK